MPLRSSSNKSYINLHGPQQDDRSSSSSWTPWYWRFIALAASWMVLGGYLMLPGLYAKDPELKISRAVLSAFVVALLTAGYSFTAMLCFACRNEVFQAEAIFLPALQSSALGLLTIAYNFLTSRAYIWNTPAITGTVVSTASTLLYGALLLWTHRRIIKLNEAAAARTANTLWSEPSWYDNYNANMYPSMTMGASSASQTSYSPPFMEGYAGAAAGTYSTAYVPEATTAPFPSAAPHAPLPHLQIQHQPPTHSHSHSRSHSRHLSEDERINQQMALLLAKQSDAGPSPDATSATFRIDLPGRGDDDEGEEEEEKELVGSPVPARTSARTSLQAEASAATGRARSRSGGGGSRVRQSLSEEEAWRRWDRGRTREASRASSSRNSTAAAGHGHSRSRAVSREERRREIELGGV
ncbi:uncharacterized protein EI97DRAFT_313936 [Westerdykella ornata]|uniref:Uncharacterized protein n=1 Tax=Westerdykella ornata TaxID=318751 RepID=A0A6A6JLV0_WESOR|nr:uncharacterized protein EI97DRAFT_313936 [Westerdykella ornata]KAF2277224.1 hypothetical protein EI97DRAFT_313936 [Westerdykella ornata]